MDDLKRGSYVCSELIRLPTLLYHVFDVQIGIISNLVGLYG